MNICMYVVVGYVGGEHKGISLLMSRMLIRALIPIKKLRDGQAGTYSCL